MTNSGSADETESEMRTRKTRQTACSRKRIWKASARQKSPQIVLEADLWKILKNSTPWVWLEWIEFFIFFQHFSAFWKLMIEHFSKNSCYSRYSIINEWPHCWVRRNSRESTNFHFGPVEEGFPRQRTTTKLHRCIQTAIDSARRDWSSARRDWGLCSKLFNLASSSLGRFGRMNPRWKAWNASKATAPFPCRQGNER